MRSVPRNVALIALVALFFAACKSGGAGRGERGPSSEGIASYYHESLAGRSTASGAPYNPKAETCAHKTLPFGTEVEIEDVQTGRTARCVVNDRGPYVKGRIIDMSRAVAQKLGVWGKRGLAKVKLTVLSLGSGKRKKK